MCDARVHAGGSAAIPSKEFVVSAGNPVHSTIDQALHNLAR
jgi:hypothetical protein